MAVWVCGVDACVDDQLLRWGRGLGSRYNDGGWHCGACIWQWHGAPYFGQLISFLVHRAVQ